MRYVTHHITLLDPIPAGLVPHNKDARLPKQMDRWPPSFLTDVWYGCCAYKAWKVPHTIETMRKISSKEYYGDTEDDGGYDPHEERDHRDDEDSGGDNIDQSVGRTPNLRKSGRRKERTQETKGTRDDRFHEPSSKMASALDVVLGFG